MQHILISKMALSSVSALAFISIFAMSTTNVHADVTTHHYDNDNDIIIYHSNTKNNAYHVNGKSFHWADLTTEQQAKIKPIQDKMADIELLFKVEEKKLSAFSKQIEEKAQAIEDEVSKLERISIKFNNDSINMRDIHKITKEFTKLSAVNHEVMRLKNAEIQEIQKELDKVDLSLVDDLQTHAHALEAILIEIAETI